MRLNNQALAEYSRTLPDGSQARENSTSNVISVEMVNRIIHPYNPPAAINFERRQNRRGDPLLRLCLL